jgi:hypothetical protein
MVLTILQWREYGADEDCLSGALMEAEPDDDEFGAARRLAEREAEVNGLEYPGDEEDPDHPGTLMFINSLEFEDGQEITTKDGRKFRIRFEEVK